MKPRFEGDVVLNPEEILERIFDIAGLPGVYPNLSGHELGPMMQLIVTYGDQWKFAGFEFGYQDGSDDAFRDNLEF